MRELKLLVVEDDPGQISNYKRDIKSFNLESDVIIIPTILDNKEDAIETLSDETQIFDAAIVDLKLDNKTNDVNEFSGNEVIRKIKSNLRFPVFVVTGTPQDLDSDLKEESSIFKVKTRGEENDYLEQLVLIFNTGITNILGRKGEIEKLLNNIFWKHLSSSLEMWISDTVRNPSQKEKSLLRYTILHILEYLDQDLEKYHPTEFYITEPIKSNIFTGDIITYQGERYIILTPSCDIILRNNGERNASRILFCKIKSLAEVIENFTNLSRNTGTNNSTRKSLEKLIQNNGKQNYHFIPKSNFIEAGFIDFQDKLTISNLDVDRFILSGEIIRIATVAMPFLKDIISRYSNYYARQGSPDFDTVEIYNSLF